MKNFRHFDIYLNELLNDVYGQKVDKGHSKMMSDILYKWIPNLTSVHSILDIGCGEACRAGRILKRINPNITYEGITTGQEYLLAKKSGFEVKNMDMSFLDYPDNSFDLIFARHVAEHSPMPILSLMEWNRVCRDFLCLIVPNPDFYARAGGQNHYYVLYADQWEALARRAGFHKIWEDMSNPTEYRFMLEKKNK